MMKKLIYKRSFMITCAIALVMTLLAVTTGALSFREGMGVGGDNAPSDNPTMDAITSDATSSDSASDSDLNGSVGTDDTTLPPPSGTGEFADDTSNSTGTGSTTADTSHNTDKDSDTPLDPEAGVATDGDGFIDDGLDTETSDTNSMSVWGIVIAILIIAAIAVLVFVFFGKKK